MNKTEIASKAKAMAKGILQTQMAVRIQGRLSKAEEAVKSAIKYVAVVVAEQAKAAAARAKAAERRQAERDEARQAIGSVNGLSAEEAAALTAEFDAEDKADDERHEANAKADAERDEKELKAAYKAVDEARENVAKYTELLRKLDAGEKDDALLVSLEDLKSLTNRLIEEGRVTEDEE